MKIQATFVLLAACLVAVAMGGTRFRREDDAKSGNDVDGGLVVPGARPDDDLAHAEPPHEASTPSPKGHRGRPRHQPCCKMPKIMDEEMIAVAKECGKSMFHNRTRGRHHRRQNGTRCWTRPSGCFAECVYKKSSLLTADNKVNYDKVLKIVSDILEKKGETEWKTLAENALKTCSNSSSSIPAQQKCQSGSQELSWCFYKQLFLTCPVQHWKKSERCDKWKEYLSGTGDKMGRKRFPECSANATEAATTQ